MWVTPKNRKLLATPTDEPPSAVCCRRLSIPMNYEYFSLVNGVLSLLIDPKNYEVSEGGLTPERTAQIFTEMWLDYLGITGKMLGAIIPLLLSELPPDMLWCDGSNHLRVDYPELYAKLDAIFHVDADTFTLPDLRQKFVYGAGGSVDVGDTGGSETHTLTVAEIPAHHHAYDPVIIGDLDVEGVGVPQPNAAQIVPLITENTYDEGGGQAHNNLPPFYALRFAVVAKWRGC